MNKEWSRFIPGYAQAANDFDFKEGNAMSADEAVVSSVVNGLAQRINRWARAKGFWDRPESVNQLMHDPVVAKWVSNLEKSTKQMLVVTEGAELVEGLRAPAEGNDHDPEAFTNEEVEVADQIIRLLDYSGEYNLRIGQCILAKMLKNEARPHKHGKPF